MSAITPLSDDRWNDASRLLKVLSHPTRLRLVRHLSEGEASVSALESGLGILQPGLSQHLGALREAGLVTTRREHKAVFYTLTDARAFDLLSELSRIFGDENRQVPRRKTATGQARLGGAAMFAITDGGA